MSSDGLRALVRAVRAHFGLSQEKFAAKVGVTLPTVSRWENGRSMPSLMAQEKLREVILEMGEAGRELAALEIVGLSSSGGKA